MLLFIAAAAVLVGAVSLLTLRTWRQPRDAMAGSDDAEWQLMVAKRSELEADVTLPAAVKETLRTEWAENADAILNRSREAAPAAAARPSPAAGLVGCVVLVAALVYGLAGRWDEDALRLHWAPSSAPAAAFAPAPQPGAAHPGSNETLEERIARLEAKLQQAPGNLEGWVLLARSRSIQRDFRQAADALERALSIAPGHPDLLAELADMLGMTAGKSLAGRPTRLVDEALRANPQHAKALSLAATAAMQRGDTRAATGYWSRLRSTVAPGSPEAGQIDAVIADLARGAAEATVLRRAAPAAASGGIAGTVRLSPALAAAWKQGLPAAATLFVVARVPKGPPVPVAVLRLPAAALARGEAVAFRLDDSHAMTPAQLLSSQALVDLEARVSLEGTAGRRRGDLTGSVRGVAVSAQGLRLTIESVVNE